MANLMTVQEIETLPIGFAVDFWVAYQEELKRR